MALYRLYCLDHDGHITRGIAVDCDDDAEARKAAQSLSGSHESLEVWQADRRVAQLPSARRIPAIETVIWGLPRFWQATCLRPAHKPSCGPIQTGTARSGLG
jgi:hypothetical protein